MVAGGVPPAQEFDAVPSWLGDTEIALLEEDDERNRKQALRNRKIRGLLKNRREDLEEEAIIQPDELGEVEKVPPKPAAEDDAEEGLPPWFVHRDKPTSAVLRLHEELLDLAAFLKPAPVEEAARWGWASAIEAAARSIWPRCGVHVFGSTSTGLCLPGADVDVSVTEVQGVRATTAMKKLAERLLERGQVSRIEIIQSARVPVMKVQHRSTGVWADVVINRFDGLETTRFVCEQLEVFPALGPLVMFMKVFLAQRRLHETFHGGMGSYVLVCVVLSFLQRHPSARNPRLYSTASLGSLLLDLFKYYGHEFRYLHNGISVRNGGSLFDRAARGWTGKTRSGQPTLCMESPADPTVDIGSRLFKIGVVRAAMIHAYGMVSALFLEDEAATKGKSLLCPHLLRRGGPVIANRYSVLQPQPPPLLELPPREDPDELGLEVDESQLPVKRRRLLPQDRGHEVSDPIGDALDILARAGIQPQRSINLQSVVDSVIKADAGEEAFLTSGADNDHDADTEASDDVANVAMLEEKKEELDEPDEIELAPLEPQDAASTIAQLGALMADGGADEEELLEVD